MKEIVHFGKALADPTRLRILAALRQGELCVCEIVDALGISQSSLSSHLQVMRQARLVATRRSARWIYYRLEPARLPLVEAVFQHFDAALQSNAQAQNDRTRLLHRLQLRVNGCCVVGIISIAELTEGGETP